MITKLAQNLIFNTCASLINFIKEIIHSQAFLERSRKEKKHFSRTRKLTFPLLVLYLCNLTKSSYQPELNKFFKVITGSTIAKNIVSKVALCKARKKLKYEAFTELNKHAIGYFNEHFSPLTWNGFYLKAVDGSTATLPNFPEICNHFGMWNSRKGDPVPKARISQMFDPLNRITFHALIAPKSVGERAMAANHFEHLTDQDLVLLDRGYPAFWIFKLILSRNAHFCSRISNKKWKVIRDFMNSGEHEQIVSIEAPTTSLEACQKHQLTSSPILVRLVRVELDSGEVEVLITSLVDCEKYPFHLFADLYHDRWPVDIFQPYCLHKFQVAIVNRLSSHVNYRSTVWADSYIQAVA